MKIIEPSYKIETEIDGPEMLRRIERAGRICYQSDHKITEDSAPGFVRRILKRGHESVIEHESFSVRFVVDRGVSHEIVRHRLAAYSQESTRYVASSEKLLSIPETKEDVIEMYERGLSMRKISQGSRFTEWDIYKILESEGVPRRPLGNHGLRDQNAFEVINTPEKAYLLGMLMCDGSVRSKSPQVNLTQKKSHSWYLKLMLEQLLGGPIGCRSDRACHQLSFSGKKLVSDLTDKGIVPNKSQQITADDADRFFSCVPDHLMRHLIHGLLDGDGYLRFFNQRGNSPRGSAYLGFSGSAHVLERIIPWIQNEADYSAKVALVSGTDKTYRVVVSDKRAVIKLCALLYGNFEFPYSHPVKTSRVFEAMSLPWRLGEWGDERFKVILPLFWSKPTVQLWTWAEAMDASEKSYRQLRELGARAEQARSVLPNSLKTEIVMTCNVREWRWVLKLRTSKKAHPQMRQIMRPLLAELRGLVPVLFDDIGEVDQC